MLIHFCSQQSLAFLICLIGAFPLFTQAEPVNERIPLSYSFDAGINQVDAWLKTYRPGQPLTEGSTLTAPCELYKGIKDTCFIDLGADKKNAAIVFNQEQWFQFNQGQEFKTALDEPVVSHYTGLYPPIQKGENCPSSTCKVETRKGFGLKFIPCKIYQMRYLKLGSYTINTKEYKNAVDGMELMSCDQGERLNLIGLPAFENQIWQFSFSEDSAWMSPLAQAPEGNWIKLKNLRKKVSFKEWNSSNSEQRNQLAKISQQIKFKAKLKVSDQLNIPLGIIYDTGARATVLDKKVIVDLTRRLEKSGEENPFEFVSSFEATDTAGAAFFPDVYRLKSAIEIEDSKGNKVSLFGNYVMVADFRDLFRQALGPEFNMILGMNHIKKTDWVFDLKEDWVYIKGN